jgi:spore germination protein
MGSRRFLLPAMAALATALLLASISSPRASSAVARARHLQVTGYAVDSTSPSTIDAQARALTTVGVDGVDVALAGNDVAMPSAGALRLLATAHADGLKAELLVGNSSGDGSSTSVATRLLTSPTNRARVAAELARLVRAQGWDGITIDIEALAPRDAQGLVAFVARLRVLLPRRYQLAVDVSATTSLAEYLQSGYHLASLSRVADVVLMAYDEDGPWSGPGPIGGLPWQRASLAPVRHVVPADRLVLGVAAYGYTWPPGARVHDGISVTAEQARRMAAASGKRPRWIRSQGEWTVRLRDGTVLWWSDVHSYELRRTVALREDLVGLAVWQLASSDVLPTG